MPAAATGPLGTGWMPMLDYLCALNGGCSLKELQVLLTNLDRRHWMLAHLRQSRIATTYLQRGEPSGQQEVRCDDLSAQNANVIYAFHGYLSITVLLSLFLLSITQPQTGSPISFCTLPSLTAPSLSALFDRVWGSHPAPLPPCGRWDVQRRRPQTDQQLWCWWEWRCGSSRATCLLLPTRAVGCLCGGTGSTSSATTHPDSAKGRNRLLLHIHSRTAAAAAGQCAKESEGGRRRRGEIRRMVDKLEHTPLLHHIK